MQDFIVIGGGIAGISVAARLSHLGRVTVLERETALGYHASGRSAALFEANYGKPSVVALNKASADYHMTANGGVLSPRGIMVVGSKGEEDVFETDVSEMDMDEISVARAIELFPILNPDTISRAAYSSEAWDIDTDRLIQNFAKEVRANGGQVITGAEVTGIDRGASGWTVTTTSGNHTAAKLVNAAGAWVDVVAAMAGIGALGFTPLRRSMARVPAPDGHDTTTWPMVFGAGETWYAKPDAGAMIVSPAEEDPAEPHDAWADDMILAEGLARYESHMTVEVTRMLSNWAGLRTFAPDRQLVLGPDPRDPSFIWMAGQGGYGFQTAPAASQLVADLTAGKTPQLPPNIVAQLTPHRLIDGH